MLIIFYTWTPVWASLWLKAKLLFFVVLMLRYSNQYTYPLTAIIPVKT